MKKKIEIIQEENSDCGIACLASIIKYYNGFIPLEILRINTNTSDNGTSAYELINYANKIGFNAYGEKVSDIYNLKLPLIAHLKLDNGYYHFVVVYEIKKDYLLIMDPSVGVKKIKKEEFSRLFTNVVIIFNVLSIIPKYKKSLFFKNIFFEYVRDNKINTIKLFILSIFILLFTIIVNLEIKLIEYNIKYLYLLVMIIIVSELIQYIKNNILINSNIKFNNKIINYFINHIFNLPSNYLKLKQKGEITTRFSELNEISSNILSFIIDIILLMFLIIIINIIIYNIKATLFLYTFIITLLYLLINYKIYKSLYNKIRYYINMEENYNSNIIDYVSKIITIKHLYNNEFFKNNINNNLINRNIIYKDIDKKIYKINMFNNIFINLVFLFLLYFLMNNSYNITNSLLIIILINYYINLVKKVIDYYPKFILYKNIIFKNNEFLSFSEEIKKKLKIKNININVMNLTYKINNNLIINNLNYFIKNKSNAFIKGPSGIGKSTFLKILNNEIGDYEGKVLFNEFNIKKYNIHNLITYTSQDEFLFNDTIRNNLLLGCNVSDKYFDKIIDICKIKDIINKIGLDTVIINSNILSGGEKNRLILARSLIHSKNIIILDEILKEVDYELEISIVKDILNYYKNKTIIYVSHKNLGYLFDNVLAFRKE